MIGDAGDDVMEIGLGVGLGAFSVMLGAAYFAEETVVAIMKPWQRTQVEPAPREEKRAWRDKYYRDENAH